MPKKVLLKPVCSSLPILDYVKRNYGTLAKEFQGVPEHLITDPADVMRATIQGIIRNQLHVFPDRTAKSIHLFKRYFPQLLDWMSAGFGRRSKSG